MNLPFRFTPDARTPMPIPDSEVREALDRLVRDAEGPAAFLGCGRSDPAEVEDLVRGLPARFRKVLVLGIGGSGLGAQAALEALRPVHAAPDAREVRILSNLDPVSVAAAMDWFDPADTLLNPVTKSGTTVETLTQFALFADRIRREAGPAGLREGIVITTDPDRGALRRVARALGCPTLPVPPKVGGRFSVLTPVGTFPIRAAGHDVRRLLAGADRVFRGLEGQGLDHPSVQAARTQVAHMLGGSHARVIWAYCDRLASFGDWFCQLWGESLGKPRGDGALGQQPVRAIGSTDQHSLLQLFMEGAPDKHLTFLTVGGPRPSLKVPDLSDLDPDLKEFAGLDVFEVFEALRAGTMAGLIEAGRPVARIHVPTLDEEALGALFAHFEVETALAGHLLGIDPFDQPGVEAGKRFAHGLLGRPGMEDWGRRARAILGEEEA